MTPEQALETLRPELGRGGVAGLHGLGDLPYPPGEQRAVPDDLTVGKRELPADACDGVGAERVLPESRTRLVEWKISVHIHMSVGHEHGSMKVEEQQRDHEAHVGQLFQHASEDRDPE